jgi:hypothetical protein
MEEEQKKRHKIAKQVKSRRLIYFVVVVSLLIITYEFLSFVPLINTSRCSYIMCGSINQARCQKKDFGFSHKRPLLIHTFWRGKAGVMLSSIIKSYLISQQLDRTKLFVWYEGDLDSSEIVNIVNANPSNVVLKRFNPRDHIAGTCLENNSYFEQFLKKHNIANYSDMVRIVLLKKYGGLWVDADVFLLRDVIPFIAVAQEFSTFQGFWNFAARYNNHVLHLSNETGTADKFLKSMCLMLEPNPPIVPYVANWWLNDGVTVTCNKVFNCDITAVDACFTDPQAKGGFLGLSSLYSCAKKDQSKAYSKLKPAYFLHHRMDDCTLPDEHFVIRMIKTMDTLYQKGVTRSNWWETFV